MMEKTLRVRLLLSRKIISPPEKPVFSCEVPCELIFAFCDKTRGRDLFQRGLDICMPLARRCSLDTKITRRLIYDSCIRTCHPRDAVSLVVFLWSRKLQDDVYLTASFALYTWRPFINVDAWETSGADQTRDFVAGRCNSLEKNQTSGRMHLSLSLSRARLSDLSRRFLVAESAAELTRMRYRAGLSRRFREKLEA